MSTPLSLVLVTIGFVYALPAPASFAAASGSQVRSELQSRVGEVKGVKENAVTKKAVAIELCDRLRSLRPTPEDAPLLASYLTLADPRELTGRLNSPTNIFPAVTLLISLQEVGAEAALDAAKIEHINPIPIAANIAYVVEQTLGPERGLARVRHRTLQGKHTEVQSRILKKVEELLARKSVAERMNEGQTGNKSD